MLESFTVRKGRETKPLFLYRMQSRLAQNRTIDEIWICLFRSPRRSYGLLPRNRYRAPTIPRISDSFHVATMENRFCWLFSCVLQQFSTDVSAMVDEGRVEASWRTNDWPLSEFDIQALSSRSSVLSETQHVRSYFVSRLCGAHEDATNRFWRANE